MLVSKSDTGQSQVKITSIATERRRLRSGLSQGGQEILIYRRAALGFDQNGYSLQLHHKKSQRVAHRSFKLNSNIAS